MQRHSSAKQYTVIVVQSKVKARYKMARVAI